MGADGITVRLRPAVVAWWPCYYFSSTTFLTDSPGITGVLKSSLGGFLNSFIRRAEPGVPGFSILYVIIPWIGVMAAGYGFGVILLFETERRKLRCLRLGYLHLSFLVVGSILIFIKT